MAFIFHLAGAHLVKFGGDGASVDCVLLLLGKQIVNDFVFAAKFGFDHQQSRSQLCVFVLEVVRSHTLLHDVVVKAFSFLMHNAGSKLANLVVDVVRRLGTHGHRGSRGRRQSTLFTELHLVASACRARSSLGSLVSNRRIIQIGLLLEGAETTTQRLSSITAQVLLAVADLAKLLLLKLEVLLLVLRPALVVLLGLQLLHLLEPELLAVRRCFGALRAHASCCHVYITAKHLIVWNLLLSRLVVSASNSDAVNHGHVGVARIVMHLLLELHLGGSRGRTVLFFSFVILLLVLVCFHVVCNVLVGKVIVLLMTSLFLLAGVILLLVLIFVLIFVLIVDGILVVFFHIDHLVAVFNLVVVINGHRVLDFVVHFSK